jgi:hypothetical protein
MRKTTPAVALRKWVASLIAYLDRWAFRDSDLRAVARGWTVRRDGHFARTHRDPRWATVQACPACGYRIVIGEPCGHCAPADLVGAQ